MRPGARKKEKEREQLRWHRWILLHRECVRRNPDYAEQYRARQRAHAKDRTAWTLDLEERWGLWTCGELPDPQQRPDLSELKTAIPPPAACLSYEEAEDPPEGAAERMLVHALHAHRKLAQQLKGFAFFLYFPDEPGPPCRYAAVDMRRPRKEIRRFMADLTEAAIASRARHRLKQIPFPLRLRVDEMFDYLRAYDLNMNGMALDDVTHELWPGLVKGSLAWNYIQKGGKLVQNPPLLRLLKEYLAARLNGRSLSSDFYTPAVVVPKTRARLHGAGYEGEARWRLGPLLVRRLSTADNRKAKSRRR